MVARVRRPRPHEHPDAHTHAVTRARVQTRTTPRWVVLTLLLLGACAPLGVLGYVQVQLWSAVMALLP